MVRRRRLNRSESKQLTRERLLQAAAEVFRERGFRSASVEQIAAEAGYTVGALYSNFAAKEDLLLALLEREIGPLAERITKAGARGTDAIDRLRRGAQEWIAFLDEEPDLYALLIEFWTLWVRDRELRPLHAERFRALRQALGELVDEEARQLGVQLTIPAEQIGAAMLALADGLALQRLADREAIPDDLLGMLLEALIPALSRQGTSPAAAAI